LLERLSVYDLKEEDRTMNLLQKTPKRNLVLWKYNLESEEKEALIFIIPEEERARMADKMKETGQANKDDMVDGEIITLNATATRVWEFADGTYTVEEMVQTLTQEYDVDRETALQDIQICLDFFTAKNLINVDWTSF
jgi:hypothetical protein